MCYARRVGKGSPRRVDNMGNATGLARKKQAYLRDNPGCVVCGVADSDTLDHIQPLDLGGPDTPDNWQTLCHSCNSSKKNKQPEYWNKYYARWPDRYEGLSAITECLLRAREV